jgi:uncharacterized protein (UPF0335 family)
MSDDLKVIFDQINELRDAIDESNEGIADLYRRAQEAGFVPRVLRRIVKLSRLSDAERVRFKNDETLQQKYEDELDDETRAILAELRAGSTFDETAGKTGAARRTVARRAKAVPKNERNGTAHVPQEPQDPEN